MKTKWTILMLASAALALLMAVTPNGSGGQAVSIEPESRGSDGDASHMASLEGCDCRLLKCQPYCVAGAVTSHGDDDRPLPPTVPASSPFCATKSLTPDGPGGQALSIEPEFRGSDGDVHHTASLEGCDCRQVKCTPYCAAGAVTRHGDHFEIEFDGAS